MTPPPPTLRLLWAYLLVTIKALLKTLLFILFSYSVSSFKIELLSAFLKTVQCIHIQREMEQCTVYFNSPQSIYTTFSYSLA